MSLDIIVDLDGTLCNCEHRVHYVQSNPKNWPAFYAGIKHDKVNQDIYQVVGALAFNANRIILCSGRDSEHREATISWLNNYVFFPWEKLYMRKERDYRPDSIVKLELLEEMRKDGFSPTLAIDDRQQVVDAFRGAGLRVLQCAPGNF